VQTFPEADKRPSSDLHMASITASQFRRQLRLSIILQALLQFWVKSANAELLSFFETGRPSLQGW
jgi:hypothetical protein